MPKRRTPLAFTIRITPLGRGGHSVETTPHHARIEETLQEVLLGRVSVRTDATTVITAFTDRSARPWATGPIAPAYVRRGILQLAEVGAEDLHQANNIVVGYLYDAVVSATVGSLRERGLASDRMPALTFELDDGPIPQFRTATYCWWRDVGHAVVMHETKTVVRLRGIPRGQTFSEWGNARILRNFRRRLEAALASP